MKIVKSRFWTGALVVLAGTALVAVAQEYTGFSGNSQRTGRHNGNQVTENPGLMRLRWGDPTLAARTLLDNWDITPGGPKAFASFNAANWGDPLDAKGASFTDTSNGTEAPYRYAFATASTNLNDYWVPQNLALEKTFTWNFPEFNVNDEVELFVNIPVGPTDIDSNAANESLRFQARYQVYRIDGVVNPDGTTDPVYQKIDTTTVLGGTVRLGLDRGTEAAWTVATTGAVRVTLINTIPRNSNGALEDAEEGVPAGTTGALVYADSATAQLVAPGSSGNIVAQPIIGSVTEPGEASPLRVVSGRNESATGQVGSTVYNTNLGVISSFRHNGLKLNAAEPGFGGSVRRNIVWSWPAKRPFANSSAEVNTFNLAKSTWLETNNRYQQTLTQDNVSVGVTASAGFVTQVLPGNKGVDALTTAAVTGAATEQVRFLKNGLIGQYTIQVWSPGGVFADRVVVNVRSLGFTIASGEVDLNGAAGWRAVQASGFPTFEAFGDLELVVTNETNDTGSVGVDVVADQVRFVKTADLSLRSTPVTARVGVNISGSGTVDRDVVVVALENGRLYCLDAQGNAVTGQTQVYWAYPSEKATDPNQVLTEDGPDGIAEMPAAFDTSSAFIERVQVSAGVFAELLYIGTTNGRVFCLDMAGRGDQTAAEYGTTTRRWSWPNDYPSAASTEYFGPITGSVSFNNDGGVEKVIVPTTSGRVFALNAAGDNTTKTTTLAWQYPLPAVTPRGPVTMSPANEFGRVYFGSGDAMIALDGTTGLESWVKTNGALGAFLPFGNSSAITVPQASAPVLPADSVYFANPDGYVYSVDAATGITQWQSNSAGAVASQPLAFTYRLNFLPSGAIAPTPSPVVIVPTLAKNYTALRAVTSIAGNVGEVAWTAKLPGAVTPVALGARQNPNPLIPDVRLDEEHTYMYGGDTEGNLVAYGYDPDFTLNQQWLPTGPPIVEEPVDPNDPTAVDVSGIARNARVAFILENDMYSLTRMAREGTVQQADVDAAILNGAAITRRHFEFGERLNFIAYDMPDPATLGSGTSYSVEFQISTPGGTTQRRSEFPRIITNASDPNRSRYVTGQIAIVGTGNNAVAPGPTTVKCSIVGYTSGSNGQAQSSADIPRPRISFGGSIFTNNPMGIRMLSTVAGNINLATTGAPLEAFGDGNGNTDLDNTTGAVVATQVLRQGFAPSMGEATGNAEIAHGNLAQARIFMYDRSCMSTLLGLDRGLPNVRAANRDLVIQGPNNSIPFKALGTNYPLFEQPISRPNGVNISLDYPDMRRSLIAVTKEASGNAENPLFTPVSLNPPAYTVADYQLYKSDGATYNAGLPRTTQATPFDYNLNTPRFQPPSAYIGTQFMYVDAQRTTTSFMPGATSTFAYRQFSANATVDVDERLTVVQETIDLGTLMGGAGFAPGVPFAAPGINFQAPVFNPSGSPFFQRFGVMNEGNVNLLNVRVAKQVEGDPDLSKLSGLGLQPSAWLNIARHLHSDVDPEYAPAGTGNRVAIQKARPGELEPTRLRVNPIRRANPAIGATQVPLLNTAQFPANEDPKIAVSIPIGAPMGNYSVNVVVFEDRDTVAAFGTPVLNVEGGTNTYEPYSDPLVLKLNVGETRLTNARPNKAVNMVDTDLGLTGKESHRWGNLQPSMVRDSSGSLYAAFASERRGTANVADWANRLKAPADANRAEYRIYIASLAGGTPVAPAVDRSPLSDLDRFTPNAPGRWFVQELNPFPNVASPETLFGLGAGETVQPGSIQFGWPTFPSSGVFASHILPTDSGRNDTFNPYMVFVAEFNKIDGSGQVTRESRLFITRMRGSSGSLTLDAPVMLNNGAAVIDPTAKIGRPSVIQDMNGNATVFFSVARGGQSQIVFATYNGTNWVPRAIQGPPSVIQSIGFSNAFELLTNPTAFVRPGALGTTIDYAFIGRVRGRSASEVMFGRMSANGAVPGWTGTWLNVWDTQVVPAEKDARTGIYWTNGVDMVSNNWGSETVGTITNPATAGNFVDVFRRTAAGYTSLLKTGTRRYNERTNNLVADCTLGGTITVNLTSGSIQFDGALIPANAIIEARYQCRFVRASGGQGANYRGVTMVFDDRMVGDTFNWRDASGNALGAIVPRQDRIVLTYLKDDQETRLGSQAIMRTFRFGFGLSQRLLTDNNGNYQISAISGNVGAFQVDPVNNRIYFTLNDERRAVTITYRTAAGNVTETLVVGVIGETSETLLPMTPGLTSMQVLLDAQSTPFNSSVSAERRANLLWLIWSSTQQGVPDLYLGSVAPFLSARP